MKQVKNTQKYRNFHLVLFPFALVLFIWPFLGTSVLDVIKSLYIYMLVTWLLVIGLIYLMSVSGTPADGNSEEGRDGKNV